MVRNNYVRAHAAAFSNQYSWCNPPSTALRCTVARRKPVSMLGVGRGWMKWCRYTQSQAHMNSAMVVMQYPAVENLLEMPLSQRDEKIQALPADGSDHTFASGIRLG